MDFDLCLVEPGMSGGWRKYQGSLVGHWKEWNRRWRGRDTADWLIGSQWVQTAEVGPICQGIKKKSLQVSVTTTLRKITSTNVKPITD